MSVCLHLDPDWEGVPAGEARLLGRLRRLVLPRVVLLDQRARPSAFPNTKPNSAAIFPIFVPHSASQPDPHARARARARSAFPHLRSALPRPARSLSKAARKSR
jgi:hypothetical protein